MAGESFVIVIDTPSIKKYVFGSDLLNEVRGASARLDHLNRVEMEKCLTNHRNIEHVDAIYANGGSAQFIVQADGAAEVRVACTNMVRSISEQTGGEVGIVYGVAPLNDKVSYTETVQMAHFQLRCQREFATCHRSTSLIPIMMECGSAPHLPAGHTDPNGDILSKASYDKRQHGREIRHHGLWEGWMQYLAKTPDAWPEEKDWRELRCEDLTQIGDRSTWRNYIGIVYADGNAMGKIVQELDQPETFRQFSYIVDGSIREACFSALSEISEPEINEIRETVGQKGPFSRLAADILLLGGDDLLVALPANRALDFALKVTNKFESFTKDRIDALQDQTAKRFFQERLNDQGFTISCGVAIAKSNYPFYLALDLAEQLLKNAKRRDIRTSQPTEQSAARIDFHVVSGANSYALEQVRKDTYQVWTDSATPRTLRPLSCVQLGQLRISVQNLRSAGFPHSKLHELHEAALSPHWIQTSLRIQEIFARCQHSQDRSQRRALWESIDDLCPEEYRFEFPWFRQDDQRILCVADLVDAYRLFS